MLDEAQAGTKIARRNISNLRYADDTTLMAESEEELKGLLMKMKEEGEKVGHDWATELNWTDSAYQLNKQGVTIYSLEILLSQFGTSPLFHVWF